MIEDIVKVGAALGDDGDASAAIATAGWTAARRPTAATRRAYRTWMLGAGGSAMPSPMWKLVWGGWL